MSGGRSKSRYSRRANQVTGQEMVLIHTPNGVQVKGEIKPGNSITHAKK